MTDRWNWPALAAMVTVGVGCGGGDHMLTLILSNQTPAIRAGAIRASAEESGFVQAERQEVLSLPPFTDLEAGGFMRVPAGSELSLAVSEIPDGASVLSVRMVAHEPPVCRWTIQDGAASLECGHLQP